MARDPGCACRDCLDATRDAVIAEAEKLRAEGDRLMAVYKANGGDPGAHARGYALEEAGRRILGIFGGIPAPTESQDSQDAPGTMQT